MVASLALLIASYNLSCWASDNVNIPSICVASQATPIIAGVTINGQTQQLSPICEKDNQFWIPEPLIKKLGVVNLHNLRELEIRQQQFIVFDKTKVSWDPRLQNLTINFPSWRYKLDSHNLSDNKTHNGLEPQSDNGAFFNYNVSASSVSQNNDFDSTISSEIGVFTSQYGFFRQTSVYKPIDNYADEEDTSRWTRLDSTWRKDDWHNLTTLELGDSTTSSAHWGGSSNFAGVSFYKNYDLNPKLDIRALPSVTESSTLPQDVNLSVNGVSVGNYQSNPGGFQFYNIPVNNGFGTITVKSQDKVGNTTTYKVPYFASDNMLKPGLSSYSFQLGADLMERLAILFQSEG